MESKSNPLDPCREARDAFEKYEDDVKAGHTGAAQYWQGRGDAFSSICVIGNPSNHEMMLHFTAQELGSPALIVDEATAKASPCNCFSYRGKDLCWSPGAIGLLDSAEQVTYCSAGKAFKDQPKLVERFNKFAAAAEEAHKKIEAIPRGERLEPWLEAMGEELTKQGIAI